MAISVHVTRLPVGGMPIPSPWWVPQSVKRITTYNYNPNTSPYSYTHTDSQTNSGRDNKHVLQCLT